LKKNKFTKPPAGMQNFHRRGRRVFRDGGKAGAGLPRLDTCR